MYAVIFEVDVKTEHKDEYLGIAAELKKELVHIDGFISIERFESLVTPGKLLSLSFWENEEAIKTWKRNTLHKEAQNKGRASIFNDYRIRVAQVERDYTLETSNTK